MTMAATVLQPQWCLPPGAAAYDNQPTLWATVLCDDARSGTLWRPLSAISVTTCRQTLWVVVTCVLLGKLAIEHQPWQPASKPLSRQPPRQIGRFFMSADSENPCGMLRSGGKSRRRGFLVDAISCIDRSWRALLSYYGRHKALLLARKHTTISQHARQQVSVVKTRKVIINNVY